MFKIIRTTKRSRCLGVPLSSLSRPRQLLGIFVLSIFLCFLFFHIPIRNAVFGTLMYKAWKDVSTPDIVHIHFIPSLHSFQIYSKYKCAARRIPTVKRHNLNASKIKIYKAHHDKPVIFNALSKGHGRFLQFLNVSMKLDYLHLFQTLREALDGQNIAFFMTAGSILGATRHGGFIPWDDDLDLGLSFRDWKEVKQALSCIQGFSLKLFSRFHWKFRYKNRKFPCIDLFFYSRTGPYFWAMTHYISRTFIYPVEHVFPLTEVDFEGVSIPMPGQGLEIAKRIYDFSSCAAYNNHMDRDQSWLTLYPNGYSKEEVSCQDLSYLYPMKNLESDSETH